MNTAEYQLQQLPWQPRHAPAYRARATIEYLCQLGHSRIKFQIAWSLANIPT